MSSHRSKFLCLWFLATPLAAGQPAPPPFRLGGVTLELSDSAFSALSVSVPALGANLCRADPSSKTEGKSKCHPKVVNNPHLTDEELSLAIVETRPSGDSNTTLVRLFPRRLSLAGSQPFNTSCGSWRYWLTLDPRATQKITQIALRPDGGDPLAGDLHGVLPMAAVLHFEEVDSARRIDMPLTLRLDLNGRWSAVPLPLAAGALDPAASNLVLFADSSQGRWNGRRECVRLSPFVGEVCLSAPEPFLKSLNAKSAQ